MFSRRLWRSDLLRDVFAVVRESSPGLVLTQGVWMPVGVVKWYDTSKGFGFIVTADGDVFVHYTVIEGTGFRCLRDGEEVEYDLQKGPKGLLAIRVKRLNPDGPRPPRKKPGDTPGK